MNSSSAISIWSRQKRTEGTRPRSNEGLQTRDCIVHIAEQLRRREEGRVLIKPENIPDLFSKVADLIGFRATRRLHRELRLAGIAGYSPHSGIFPCFLRGFVSTFVSSRPAPG